MGLKYINTVYNSTLMYLHTHAVNYTCWYYIIPHLLRQFYVGWLADRRFADKNENCKRQKGNEVRAWIELNGAAPKAQPICNSNNKKCCCIEYHHWQVHVELHRLFVCVCDCIYLTIYMGVAHTRLQWKALGLNSIAMPTYLFSARLPTAQYMAANVCVYVNNC